MAEKCLESHVMKMYQVDAFTQVLFKGNPAADSKHFSAILDFWSINGRYRFF
jgi:hypothetical protein